MPQPPQAPAKASLATLAPLPIHLIVDRFEGEVAVLEVAGGRLVDVPRRQLPADVAEGDVLTAFFTIDHEATAERRRLMADLHRRIAR